MSGSIATRTGDDGTTGLLYGARLGKEHPRIELLGTVDELSATLSAARAFGLPPEETGMALQIQQDLVALMAEVAVAPPDRTRYLDSGLARLQSRELDRLDEWVGRLEGEGIVFAHWNQQHFTVAQAHLEIARTICRRAERRFWGLETEWRQEADLLGQYLNRLSDALWLLARRPSPIDSPTNTAPAASD